MLPDYEKLDTEIKKNLVQIKTRTSQPSAVTTVCSVHGEATLSVPLLDSSKHISWSGYLQQVAVPLNAGWRKSSRITVKHRARTLRKYQIFGIVNKC